MARGGRRTVPRRPRDTLMKVVVVTCGSLAVLMVLCAVVPTFLQ